MRRSPGRSAATKSAPSRARLQELTRRLDDHISRLESFAADMAHEFKNPLASIRAAADTIADAESDDDRQRFLSMMRRDVERLDRLVAAVREMARIDNQLEHEALASVDLHELLNTVVETVRLTSSSPATVVMRDVDRACMVRGTPERLAQAFENILSNAMSFAPADTAVEVTTAVTETFCSRNRRRCRSRHPRGAPATGLRSLFLLPPGRRTWRPPRTRLGNRPADRR